MVETAFCRLPVSRRVFPFFHQVKENFLTNFERLPHFYHTGVHTLQRNCRPLCVSLHGFFVTGNLQSDTSVFTHGHVKQRERESERECERERRRVAFFLSLCLFFPYPLPSHSRHLSQAPTNNFFFSLFLPRSCFSRLFAAFLPYRTGRR